MAVDAFQRPASCQARSRRQHVMPEQPATSKGNRFQGMAVYRTNRMPVKALRASTGGRQTTAAAASLARSAWCRRPRPSESPQSNGMAEAFVRTLKRDYVRVSPVPDAASVLRQQPLWLAHYNELHLHRALGYRSPREFIARSTQEALSGL